MARPSPGQACRVAQVMLFAAAVPVLVRLPLPRLAALLEPRHAPPAGNPARIAAVVAEVEAALTLGGRLVRRSCLIRGLTRYYFLRRAGLPVALCFGVRLGDDGPVGHCWLVQQDEPYLEMTDPRCLFTEVYRIPSAARPWAL